MLNLEWCGSLTALPDLSALTALKKLNLCNNALGEGGGAALSQVAFELLDAPLSGTAALGGSKRVLDLRNNPGGTLQYAMQSAALFFDDGLRFMPPKPAGADGFCTPFKESSVSCASVCDPSSASTFCKSFFALATCPRCKYACARCQYALWLFASTRSDWLASDTTSAYAPIFE